MSQASSSAAARVHPSTWLATASLALYYALSMSRDLSLYDSGELALAAVQPGLGHPPGQPLHTLLGFVFSRVTFGAPLIGVNLLSALPSALCVLPATRLAEALCGERATQRARWYLPWLMIPLALHASIWEPATRVEVYALASFCALCAVAAALPLMAAAPCSETRSTRAAWWSGALLGLCASANPGIALAVGLALAPALLATREPQLWLRVIAGGLLGLAPYAYLFYVAGHTDVAVWGGLHDRAQVLRYLTLGDYSHNRKLGALGQLEHAFAWGQWALAQLLVPGLIFGLGGFVRARRRVRFAPLLFVIASGMAQWTIASNLVWDLQVPDYNGYLATSYWLAAAGGAALFASALVQGRLMACGVLAGCLVLSCAAPPAPWARTRHVDRLARRLAEEVLREAPARAIVISQADYYAGSLFYLQEAEHQRPDVSVLAYGLSGSSWHWRHMLRRHPGLAPVSLQPGPRALRVRRWLEANADRPVIVEQLSIARELGLAACAGGLYLRTGAACGGVAPAPVAARLLARELAVLDAGSPSAAEAIAQVSEQLGLSLWQLGALREAHHVLLAGVPRAQWPARIAGDAQLTAAGGGARFPARWRRHAALGDAGRNLFLAGALVAQAGQEELARGYALAAARLQLPEALQLLSGGR